MCDFAKKMNLNHGNSPKFPASVPRFSKQKAVGRPAGALESIDLLVSNRFLLRYSGPAKKGGLTSNTQEQGGGPPFIGIRGASGIG